MEKHVLLITPDAEAMAPLVSVIKTLLQHKLSIVTPQHAIAAAKIVNYDLFMLDMQGGVNSLAFIHSLKQSHKHVPLIAMVPYGNIDIIEKVLESGADDYISQPISITRLKTALRNALRVRTLLLQLHADSASILPYVNARQHTGYASLFDKSGQLKTMREIEDLVIEHAIDNCEGCITRAARSLGIGRSTLYRKISHQMSRENQTTRPMITALSSVDS